MSRFDSGTCLDVLESGEEDKRGIKVCKECGAGDTSHEHSTAKSFQTDDEPQFKPLVVLEGSVTKLGEHFQIGTSNPTATVRNLEFYLNQPTKDNSIVSMAAGGTPELPEEEEYEKTVLNNVAKLFESVATQEMRSSIFLTDILVSHLCAVNPNDGATCFHRLVQSGDHVTTLELLLKVNSTGINIQDNKGWSSLHLAVYLKRRKMVERLLVSKQ